MDKVLTPLGAHISLMTLFSGIQSTLRTNYEKLLTLAFDSYGVFAELEADGTVAASDSSLELTTAGVNDLGIEPGYALTSGLNYMEVSSRIVIPSSVFPASGDKFVYLCYYNTYSEYTSILDGGYYSIGEKTVPMRESGTWAYSFVPSGIDHVLLGKASFSDYHVTSVQDLRHMNIATLSAKCFNSTVARLNSANAQQFSGVVRVPSLTVYDGANEATLTYNTLNTLVTNVYAYEHKNIPPVGVRVASIEPTMVPGQVGVWLKWNLDNVLGEVTAPNYFKITNYYAEDIPDFFNLVGLFFTDPGNQTDYKILDSSIVVDAQGISRIQLLTEPYGNTTTPIDSTGGFIHLNVDKYSVSWGNSEIISNSPDAVLKVPANSELDIVIRGIKNNIYSEGVTFSLTASLPIIQEGAPSLVLTSNGSLGQITFKVTGWEEPPFPLTFEYTYTTATTGATFNAVPQQGNIISDREYSFLIPTAGKYFVGVRPLVNNIIVGRPIFGEIVVKKDDKFLGETWQSYDVSLRPYEGTFIGNLETGKYFVEPLAAYPPNVVAAEQTTFPVKDILTYSEKVQIKRISTPTLKDYQLNNVIGWAGYTVNRKSLNGSSYFIPCCQNTIASLATSSIVKDNFIFVGTHGWGVYRSSDSGVTWTSKNVGIATSNTANAMGVSLPTITAFATHGQYLFCGTESDGAYVSTDDGVTWEKLPFYDSYAADGNAAVTAMHMTGQYTLVIAWHSDRGNAISYSFAVPGEEYTAWYDTFLTEGEVSDPITSIISVADTIYVAQGTSLWKCNNIGSISWVELTSALPSINTLGQWWNPSDQAWEILAGTVTGLYAGGNIISAGSNWVEVSTNLPEKDVVSVYGGSGLYYVGTSNGIYSSENNDVWTDLNSNFPASPPLRITSLTADASYLYATAAAPLVDINSEAYSASLAYAWSHDYLDLTAIINPNSSANKMTAGKFSYGTSQQTRILKEIYVLETGIVEFVSIQLNKLYAKKVNGKNDYTIVLRWYLEGNAHFANTLIIQSSDTYKESTSNLSITKGSKLVFDLWDPSGKDNHSGFDGVLTYHWLPNG